MNYLFNKRKLENIIFLHIPKAGGTTLRHVFLNQYKYLKSHEIYTINRTKETEIFQNLSHQKKQEIKLLIGHMPFGMHKELNHNFKYITFLRNPIERVISAYYYNKENESSDVFDLINGNKLSLYDYLLNNIEPWSMNAMTKHLYGCNQKQFKENCTEDMFNEAINNLNSNFIFTGIVEEFNKSLIILKEKLNWSNPYYKSLNITKNKISKSEIDSNVLQLISELNFYDIKLYKFARIKFLSDWNMINNSEKKLAHYNKKLSALS